MRKISQRKPLLALAIASMCALPLAGHGESSKAAADYSLAGQVKLGAPNFWDYLVYDPLAKRLYASHIDKIEVLDATSGKVLGQVSPFHDAHGIAIVNDLGKGYADSGDDGVVKVFDLNDFHVMATIKVATDADGMQFDPKTRSVLVVAGDSKSLTVIDPKSDRVVRTVTLPGKPEYFAVDASGNAYVNIADKDSIVKVDIMSGSIVATWPLDGCKDPHGLGYDPKTNKLFSGCANNVMIVVDASSGKNLARLPIGEKSDSVVVDSKRGRALSANADGTMTVVSEESASTYAAETILSPFGGRNAAIDDSTGTVYVANGNMKLMSSTHDTSKLRFGWDGMNIAILKPRN